MSTKKKCIGKCRSTIASPTEMRSHKQMDEETTETSHGNAGNSWKYMEQYLSAMDSPSVNLPLTCSPYISYDEKRSEMHLARCLKFFTTYSVHHT